LHIPLLCLPSTLFSFAISFIRFDDRKQGHNSFSKYLELQRKKARDRTTSNFNDEFQHLEDGTFTRNAFSLDCEDSNNVSDNQTRVIYLC
jgi:hypothetical protein